MLNRINIAIFYVFSIYPIVGFITMKTTNIAAGNLLGVLLFLLLPLILITREPNEIKFPTYLKFYLVFVALTIFSDFINGKIDMPFNYAYRNGYIKTFLILFTIENTYVNKILVKNLKKIMFIILTITFVVIILQVVIGPMFLVRESFMAGRPAAYYRAPSIFSWIDNPTDLGFTIPMIISILVSENYLTNTNKRNYILYFMGSVISLINRSRWIMVSMIVVSWQIIKYGKDKSTIYIKYIFSIVLFLLITYQVLFLSGIDVNKIIEERILESKSSSLEEKSAGTRILAVYLFIQFFPESPIFGTGGVMKSDLVHTLRGRSSQIHVGFLSLFYYYGLVGGIIYLAFLYYLLKRLKFVAETTNYWGSYYALLTFPIANLTLVSFGLFNMGVVMAMVFHKFYEQQLLSGEEVNEIEEYG